MNLRASEFTIACVHKIKNIQFNINCWKMSQNIPCTGWGLEQYCGLHHFPSADAGAGWVRGSSMNKTKGGDTRHGTGTSCSIRALALEVCHSFHTGISKQGPDPPGCSAICPALCSSLLCRYFVRYFGDRIGKIGCGTAAVLAITSPLSLTHLTRLVLLETSQTEVGDQGRDEMPWQK